VLDAPPAPSGGEPSTLIEPQDNPRFVRILRAGAITAPALERAGFVVVRKDCAP
jgi:hypothetical protein